MEEELIRVDVELSYMRPLASEMSAPPLPLKKPEEVVSVASISIIFSDKRTGSWDVTFALSCQQKNHWTADVSDDDHDQSSCGTGHRRGAQ